MNIVENINKENKKIMGKKENDPKWVKDIASYLRNDKEEKYKKQLRKLFLEYTREGLKPIEAWEKAKRVLECFKT